MSDLQGQEIVDLQMRVAFQEETLQEMSDQMAALTLELQLASKQIQLLSDKVKSGATNDDEPNTMPVDERPPHY